MAGYIGNKAVNLSTSGADISGTTNLDAVDIDGAVNMATTALVTGVLTTTAAPVFNGGFASNAACTITTADNLSGLIVASTDADANAGPTIQLKRDSSSPADNDLAGNIIFVAENDASEATVYANIGAHLQDVTNGTEDGKFFINTMIAGAEKSRMFMPATETVFNEESADIDFRVESNGNDNMLFVDGGNNAVVIGHNDATNGTFASSQKLQMVGTDFLSSSFGLSRFSADGSGPSISLSKSRAAGIGTDTVVQNNDDLGSIIFTGADGTDLSTQGAEIKAEVDGTPGGNDMPTRLTFATTGDGNSSPTERMRLTNAGGVLIGTTSNSSIGEAGYRFIPGATGYSEFVRTGSDGSANIYIARGDNGRALSFFRNDSSNREVGTVTVTTNSTAYNTSSDYRLKENVNYDWDATTRLKQLKPARFNFILDADTTVDGFLAHEAQAVVPESVTGTKDAMRDEEYQVSAATGDIYTPATDAYVDEDGNDVDAVEEVIHSADAEQPETLADGQQWRETKPAVMGTRSVPVMQGIDQSKLVPLLVKTILELEARITALENA